MRPLGVDCSTDEPFWVDGDCRFVKLDRAFAWRRWRRLEYNAPRPETGGMNSLTRSPNYPPIRRGSRLHLTFVASSDLTLLVFYLCTICYIIPDTKLEQADMD